MHTDNTKVTMSPCSNIIQFIVATFSFGCPQSHIVTTRVITESAVWDTLSNVYIFETMRGYRERKKMGKECKKKIVVDI